jgi:hypothetical protein
MKNVLVAGILGGVVVFIWSFISWAIIPWHAAVMNSIPSGEQVAEILKNDGLEAGFYHHPGFPEEHNEDTEKAWSERYMQGPNINFLIFSPVGADPMDPMQFIRSLILNILSAILASYMLLQALSSLNGLLQRAFYVMALGGFVALVYPLAEWNWWNFPADFTLVAVCDTIITWFLGGLAIAWRIKPGNV